LVAALISERADFHDLKVPPSIVTVDDYRKRALVAQRSCSSCLALWAPS